MTKPEHLNTAHSATLTGILARCPALRAVRRHVAAFATMMRDLGGELLDGWLHAVETDDLPALHTLVTGLRRDTPRSPPDSPCPTAPAPSKARSTASRHSNAPCTAAPTWTCSANASSSRTESHL